MRLAPLFRDIDYLRVIALHKWMIVSMVLLSVTLAALKMASLPVLYEASITMIATVPAWEDRVGKQIRPVMESLGRPFQPIQITLFESFYWELFSRTLADAVIEEIDLTKHYHVNSMSQARAILMANRLIQLSREYTLQVTVLDRDPAMAAAIANAHARQLDRLDRTLLAQSASARKQFFQRELERTRAKLGKAEKQYDPTYFSVEIQSLSDGQKKETDGERINEETEESDIIENFLAGLKERAMEMEAERVGLLRFATPLHPEMARLEAQSRAVLEVIKQKEDGQDVTRDASVRDSFFPSFGRRPDLALKLSRYNREARNQAAMYLRLRATVEDIMIQESLDLPRVWVLEPAIPSERQVKGWQTMVVAGGLAAILGVLLAFVFSYLERLQQMKPAIYSEHGR